MTKFKKGDKVKLLGTKTACEDIINWNSFCESTGHKKGDVVTIEKNHMDGEYEVAGWTFNERDLEWSSTTLKEFLKNGI